MRAVLTSLLDGVMERRAALMLDAIDDWLPRGTALDVGSGTGHLAAAIARRGLVRVATADVTDMHVTGPAPALLRGDRLPFDDRSFDTVLLAFMLGYPADAAGALREAARVSRGAVIVVQTLSSGRFGRGWHRVREFVWTVLAFHLSKVVGYVPRGARFSMNTRRFYSPDSLWQEIERAGLRETGRRERAVAGRSIVVASLRLVRDARDA